MIIRAAELKDATALSQLLTQLGYPTESESCLEKINVYSKDGYRMLVAESQNKVVAFISLHWYVAPHLPGPTGRITAFCVDEASRGKGVGTDLLKAAEDFFAEQNCYKIEVTSNLKRKDTHQYYLNLAYQETSRHFVKFLRED